MSSKSAQIGEVPAHWNVTELIDYLDRITYGFTNPMPDADAGPWKITAKDIVNGYINYDTARKTTPDAFAEKLTDKSRPNVGDILLTKDGSIGRVAVVDRDNICINQSVALLQPNKKIDSYFLKYLLIAPHYQRVMIGDADGSTIKHIYITRVDKMEVAVPPLGEQQDIVNIVKTLDDKILVNQRINQTLEQIAQAIFKSWFVDFEPVKAKQHIRALGGNDEQTERAAQAIIGGAVNLDVITAATDLNSLDQQLTEALDEKLAHQTETQREQLTTTASHFPDQLVESELGLIPEDWEESSVGQEFDLVMGQSPPGNTYNENGEGIPFFQGRRDFGWRYPINRVYCTEPKRLASKGDTLLSVRAPVGDVNKATTGCCIGRGIAALRHKSGCEAITYYSALNLSRVFESFDSEGTVFGAINQKDLKALRFVAARKPVLESFSSVAGAIDSQIENMEEQIRALVLIRDLLLPKLLSGDLQ